MRHIICSVFHSFTTCPALISSQVLAPANNSKSPNASQSVKEFSCPSFRCQ
jgi:hypothetical protein